MENVGKYLPIGSVVILKGGKKRVMVTGFLGKAVEDDTKVFDYIGCLFPEGIVAPDSNVLFNHANIDKIFFLGYSDAAQKEFAEILKKYDEETNKN